jgi:hypothetical protein
MEWMAAQAKLSHTANPPRIVKIPATAQRSIQIDEGHFATEVMIVRTVQPDTFGSEHQ